MQPTVDTKFKDLEPSLQAMHTNAARTFLVALTGVPSDLVAFSPEIPTAYWDSERRCMVISTSARLGEIPGFMAHEVLHALETDPKAWDRALVHASHPSVNICEDIRINTAGAAKHYRNGGAWIKATAESIIRHDPDIRQTQDVGIQVLLMSQDLGHYLDNPHPDAVAWMRDHASNVLAAKSCDDPGFIEAAKALDKQAGRKPQPPPQDGEGGKPGGKGQGGAPGGKGQGGKPGGKSKGGKPAGDGTAEAEAEAEAEKAAKEGNGPGDWFKPEDHAEPKDIDDDAKGGATGAQDNGRRRSRAYGVDVPEQVDPARWGNDGSNGATFDATVQALARWRSRLAEALMAEDRGGWNRHQRTGQLDARKIALIPYGTSEQVFMQRGATRRAVNTAIDLVVDQSGSTDNTYRTAAVLSATCASLAQAISRIPGTSIGVLLYDHNFCRVSGIQPGLGIKAQTLRDTCRGAGGTMTNTAVGLSSKALNDYKQAQRRICIVLTDAQPPTKAEAQAAEMIGVETHTVVIAGDENHAKALAQVAADASHGYIDWEHAHVTHTADIPKALDALVRALRIRGA